MSPLRTPVYDVFVTNQKAKPNEHHGGHLDDAMRLPKPTNTTRCSFWNPNGLSISNQASHIKDTLQYERDIQSDLIGYFETKLNQQHSEVKKAFHNSAKTIFGQQYIGAIGGSSIQYDSTVKYGGTLAIAVHATRGRVIETYIDPWGRWSLLILQGKQHRTIVYISAYQVCARPTNKQGSTAYHQQEALARLEKRSNLNPRKNFQQDLRKYIRTKMLEKCSIILAGDFNESSIRSNSGMYDLISACELIDVWEYRNPDVEFNTRHPGKQRIDYVLITPDLMESVQAIGYQPFQYRGHSDHRSLYIDFDTEKLFGNATNPLANAPDRGVNSHDPFHCATYVQSAGRHAVANNLFQLTEQLLSLEEPDHSLVEKIDDILGQAMSHGDRKCVSRRRPWWSYKLHQERMWKSVLRRHLSSLRTNMDTVDVLSEVMRKHRLTQRSLPRNLISCTFQIAKVTREIKRLETESFVTRQEEKIAIAQIKDDTGEKDRAKLIREIARSEQQSETFRMFSHIRNPTQTSSLTHVEIPEPWPESIVDPDPRDPIDPKEYAKNPNAQWRQITQPEEINYFIRLRNRRHFGQAHGTPFTVPPLSYEVDWSASTLTAEAILDGSHPLEYSETLAHMLSECKRRTAITSVTGHITVSEFENKFKKWRESTTTSPSGRHLGLYKALFRRHSLTSESDINEYNYLRKSLLQTHVAIINYCLKFRYSLTRWQNIVNVMLLKKPGDYRIHRLRVIHLYEADFNFVLGTKWRQLMHNAADQQAIHRSQYGGRPGGEATTLSLIEELKTDITYCSRKPLINFDNDAAACYDRIITSLASLVSRSFGQNRDVCFVHAQTLELAKFRLKTALGVSDEFYQHCTTHPIYGTGQGSGNSPAIWVFISSVLFTCHEHRAYGAIFESPDRSVRVTFSMVGFVDDSTGQVNDFLSARPPKLDRLVKMMAHDAQLWNDLLSNSGGLLEISKCSYHILYFQFRRDGTPYMALGTKSPELRLRNKQVNQTILVKRLLSFESHETLGHFKAPAGNQSAHLKKLTKTGVTLARQLYASAATRAQARLFYWSIYIPSIRYSLPQCFFSYPQLHDAQAKSFPLILAKAGFLRTMPYSIVFGPVHMGGAGFVRWATLQGEGQVMLFLKHWRAHDDAGQLLRVALSWAQFQAGTSHPILQDTDSRLPHVESRWIPALRRFLASIDAKLYTDRTYIVPPQREGDEYIMDVIITIDELTDKDIHILNCCRLYLDVITISDLVDATGAAMDSMIANHLPSFSSHSKLHTPVQDRPTSWALWDIVMQRWFTENNTLRRPLGKWLYPGDRLRRTWSIYYDTADQCVYHRVVDGFVQSTGIGDSTGSPEITDWRPTATSFPVSTEHYGHSNMYSHPVISGTSQRTPSIAPTFENFVQTLSPWERPLLETIQFIIPPFEFLSSQPQEPLEARELLAGGESPTTLHLVSDGSHARHSMSFGWTFARSDGTRIAECNGPGYGPGTSHRAEGYGVLSAVQFVFRLRQFLHVQDEWKIKFVSDNKGLITRIQNRRRYQSVFPNSTLEPDWDLVEQIHNTLSTMAVQATFEHVKGHQDDSEEYAALDLDAQLNVDADRLAGEYNADFASDKCIVPMLPSTGVQLQIGHRTITSRMSKHIRNAAGQSAYLSYLSSRNAWNLQTWDTVDQAVLRRVIARHSHQYVNVVKMIHDFLPTSAVRKYADSTISPTCKLCHAEKSTFSHLLRCPHPTRIEWRQTFLRAVRTACETSTTRLGILQAIIAGLTAWFRGGRQVDPCAYAPDIGDAIREQNAIGWHGFLRGMCSKRWAQLQHCHLSHNNLQTCTNTGTAWLLSLVTTMWKHVFQLWDAYTNLVHGEDRKANREHAIRRVRTKIRTLHEQASNIRVADQQWLLPDMDTFLAHSSLSQLHRWYATYEPVIIDAIKITRDESTANTKSLRSYFPTSGNPRHGTHRAARPQQRSSHVKAARTQDQQRQQTPRPRPSSSENIRRYFRPLSILPEHPSNCLRQELPSE